MYINKADIDFHNLDSALLKLARLWTELYREGSALLMSDLYQRVNAINDFLVAASSKATFHIDNQGGDNSNVIVRVEFPNEHMRILDELIEKEERQEKLYFSQQVQLTFDNFENRFGFAPTTIQAYYEETSEQIQDGFDNILKVFVTQDCKESRRFLLACFKGRDIRYLKPRESTAYFLGSVSKFNVYTEITSARQLKEFLEGE